VARTEGLEAHFSYKTWPFYWLARASGRYLRGMEEALKPLGLDMPQWRVLMTLHEDRVASVSEIAEHSSAKLPTMTKIIKRMQADGLVECGNRAGDARVTDVCLTASGEVAGREAWEAANSLYQRAFRGMSASDLRTLTRLLCKVAENLKHPG